MNRNITTYRSPYYKWIHIFKTHIRPYANSHATYTATTVAKTRSFVHDNQLTYGVYKRKPTNRLNALTYWVYFNLIENGSFNINLYQHYECVDVPNLLYTIKSSNKSAYSHTDIQFF